MFSFSKFLMWEDIHNNYELLKDNKIINSLIANRLTWTPSIHISSIKDVDRKISPLETAIPVPADSSQLTAVIEASMGNSFILYGPPGTGKSQTITNLIANALFHGKRVLFVAEKMAALSVVKQRLDTIGLGPFCMELHSNKASKRHVLSQLDKTLNVTHIVNPKEYEVRAEQIYAERKKLITYLTDLHKVDTADGLSIYDCIKFHESIAEPPIFGFTYQDNVDRILLQGGLKEFDHILGAPLIKVLKLVGQPSQHPLNGLKLSREMYIDSKNTILQLNDDLIKLTEIYKRYNTLSRARDLRERIIKFYSPQILDEDADELHRQWVLICSKSHITQFFSRRKFIRYIKKYNRFITSNEIDSLLENLVLYKQFRCEIDSLNTILFRYFHEVYDENTLPSVTRVEDAIQKLSKWNSNSSYMRDWLHWSEYSKELNELGLGCVVNALDQNVIEPSSIQGAYLKALLKYKVEEKMIRSETLATFEGMLFDEQVALYRQLTEEFQVLTQKELYARLAARIPRMTDSVISGSEIGLLNRNISNGGRGLSLRALFDKLPDLMPRLCPCMLMSPMSVAQYMNISGTKFDLVIFDEASQVPTSDAVGAIARGHSLIVVGDPKQMPPTMFFASNNVEAEDASIDDMESILEDCRTLDMPSYQLSWHYRSRHESLIAFSNNEYYDDSLITFPSIDDKFTRVYFKYIHGSYEKGGSRVNKLEAEAVVNEILRRLKDKELRNHSIGVIAFSKVQQDLIEDKLLDALEKDHNLQREAENMPEKIFVKNLENVQGDERDVILFSIGYGPDKNGKISMNFGPLNKVGGERRLNVAVSRAREEMVVFSSLKAADIDLKKTKAKGVEGLKHFLQYSETKNLPSKLNTNINHQSSSIAEQISNELRKLGYHTSVNVGRSKFRIDVAVEDKSNPGIYSLGILLDGECYRDTNTTRDREVVQPSVLSTLNWRVMRVYSIDWFNNRERVICHILENIQNADKVEKQIVPAKFDISNEPIAVVETRSRQYIFYNIPQYDAICMPQVDLMKNIISTEQPITYIYLCKRINALRNLGRLTMSLQRSIRNYIDEFYMDNEGALWISKDHSLNYSCYRTDSGRNISDIPKIEIKNVIIESIMEYENLDEDNLIRIASKKIGFYRRGSNVDSTFKNVLRGMLIDGDVEMKGDKFQMTRGTI